MILDIISKVLSWLIPAVCGGILTWSLTAVRESRAERDGLKCLLRAEIIRNYEKYSDRGYCPIYARDPLAKAYEAYHALGGNSTATELYHKTIALPTQKGE